VSVCEIDQGCQLSIKLDLKLPMLWHKPDLFDKFTDAFGRFQAGMLVIEGFGQIHDLLTVQLGKVRMQSRHGRRRSFQLTDEIDPPGFQTRHLVLYGGARHARLDSIDDSANIAFGLLQVARESIPTSILFSPLQVYLSVELFDEGRD
jgi:hypothetical protein